MKKIITSVLLASLTSLVIIANISPTSAAPRKCVPVKPTGVTVGKISLDSVSMPVKAFNYPAGGEMSPQGSTYMAGLSERHMPLSSTMGSSVLVWHKDYNGCSNRLNLFFDKRVGAKFTISDENGDLQKYKIVRTKTVEKGAYQPSWFTLIGPRQLVLVTCTGAFKNGHYSKNYVVIAKPI